jgi:hypothetical protein
MSTETKSELPAVDAPILNRILDEGYGPGAWHGNDIKAAIADVPEALAFWRPAPQRHSIAEISIHHAFYVHSVRERMLAAAIEPFPLEGDDWFVAEKAEPLTWSAITSLVQTMHERLAAFVADAASGRARAKLSDTERFGLILGITCHSAYHAGQVQLIKALNSR